MLANWAAAAAEDVAFGRRGLLPGVLCSIEAMLASWAAAAAEDGAFGRQQPRPRQWEGTVEELWEIQRYTMCSGSCSRQNNMLG